MDKTIQELLNDRGYDISTLVINDTVINVTHEDHECVIVYEVDNKLRKNNIFDIITEYNIEEHDKLILILNNKLNIPKDIHSNIEIFIKPFINITKHSLVPKHSLLTNEEVDELKLEVNKLPLILRKDPVIRWYNFKPGGVCKIDRKNGSIFYRLIK